MDSPPFPEADVADRLRAFGVVPVLAPETVDDGLRTCEALAAAGLPVAEITFRTRAAPAILEAVRARFGGFLLGAGTVLDGENLRRAFGGGAEFAVAPGHNPAVAGEAVRRGWPFFPGVCTPSEIEGALAAGFRLLKFFPAEAMGGARTLSSMAAPYRHLGVRFMPTGGVTPDNLAGYLALPEVACVGGTWLGHPAGAAAGQWEQIRLSARVAVEAAARRGPQPKIRP